MEERSLTPITTDTAYAKPPIHKRRKLIAAAHEFSELMTFNRIEVDTEVICMPSFFSIKSAFANVCGLSQCRTMWDLLILPMQITVRTGEDNQRYRYPYKVQKFRLRIGVHRHQNQNVERLAHEKLNTTVAVGMVRV